MKDIVRLLGMHEDATKEQIRSRIRFLNRQERYLRDFLYNSHIVDYIKKSMASIDLYEEEKRFLEKNVKGKIKENKCKHSLTQ